MPPPLTKYWLSSLNLTPTDKEELVSGDWLTDKHINATGKFLQQQFPQ